jgi:predicted nucleic acid-binding protein
VIIVDSNVIAYCWLNGERTALAHQMRRYEPEWHAPVFWRSEMRSILVGYRRDGSLTAAQAFRVMEAAEAGMAGREHHLPNDRVFEVAGQARLSAYDSEFVALARIMGVRLVTEDRAILSAFPEFCVTMRRFLEIQQK